MLNAAHSSMHEQIARLLGAHRGWQFRAEVSFSIYGERGVIDVLAFHAASGTLLVIELKTALIDVQALIGAVDRYLRLSPQIARDLGWSVRLVGAWVVVSDTATNRRRLANHRVALRSAFPADGRQIRAWLGRPTAPVRSLSFLMPARNPRRIRQRHESGR